MFLNSYVPMKKPSERGSEEGQECLPICDRHTSVWPQGAEWCLQQNKTKQTLLRSLPFDSWAFSLPVIPGETDPDLSSLRSRIRSNQFMD